VFISGTQEDAIILAASKGYSLFLPSHESSSAVAEKAGRYWDALERAGREREEVSFTIARDVYVETNGRQARERVSKATEHSFIGDPDEVFHEIKCLQQATGAAHIVCRMNLPGIPHEMVVESMKLLAAEVMTRLQV
jgi:alkanesulfonate monooxygenase SsuD/methylene tetrahydromethanopterin reductase-like flavin-dependent oxidoreductase (luciferase family)